MGWMGKRWEESGKGWEGLSCVSYFEALMLGYTLDIASRDETKNTKAQKLKKINSNRKRLL
jgi:hypothetical protein